MSKKRVHELAKQLKEAGIELSNQELVEKLHALGYDVKSHSSSLEEDQSQSAYERIVAEKKPKAPAPRPTGPGFVVRKRAHVEPAPAAPASAAPAPAAEPAHEPAEEAEAAAEQAAEATAAREAGEPADAG